MNAKSKKCRADQLLVEQGKVETRSKAQALILAGHVEYLSADKWKRVSKAGDQLLPGTEFRIDDPNLKDVGRGAQKLRGAFDLWPEISKHCEGASALDIGSSTGGFTQVLLEKGVSHVVALDVGTHQLHEKLRSNKKVLSLEQTHVLKINETFWLEKSAGHSFEFPFGIMVMDVSFISSTKVLSHAHSWLVAGGYWIILVKPQFELEPKKLVRGIVKEPKYREEALESVIGLAKELGCFKVIGQSESPITGMDGNVEYLLCLKKLPQKP
jgi:23S rRNA (cytidine1920-2'-O)/16S rRNA (cytidine1409-2'-O)-methyltransferase